MGERCCEVRKSRLGEDHPHTLVSMSNLAWYYNRLGDSRKAAEMGKRCWEMKKTISRRYHPDSLSPLENPGRQSTSKPGSEYPARNDHISTPS